MIDLHLRVDQEAKLVREVAVKVAERAVVRYPVAAHIVVRDEVELHLIEIGCILAT